MNIAGVHYGFSGAACKKTLLRSLCGDQRQTSPCSPSHFAPVDCKLTPPSERLRPHLIQTHARQRPQQIRGPSRCERRSAHIHEMMTGTKDLMQNLTTCSVFSSINSRNTGNYALGISLIFKTAFENIARCDPMLSKVNVQICC